MSYQQQQYYQNQRISLYDVCKYWNPWQHNSCIRGNGCRFHHLSSNEFEQLIYSSYDKQSLRKLAWEFDKAENYKCSNTVFSRLLDLKPNHSANNFGYAQSLSGLGDYQSAQKYFIKAIDIAPNDYRAHSLYANFLHSKLNDTQKAKGYYAKALQLDNNNSHTHCNYGKLLEDFNELDDAEYHYKKGLELEKNNRSGLYRIALFYHYKRGDLNKAKKYFDRLISLMETQEIKQWFDYFQYGLLLRNMKYFKDALQNFNIALLNCFNDLDKADICYEIGRVYDENIGNIDNARFHFNKAQQLNGKRYAVFFQEFLQCHPRFSNTKSPIKQQDNKTNNNQQRDINANNNDQYHTNKTPMNMTNTNKETSMTNNNIKHSHFGKQSNFGNQSHFVHGFENNTNSKPNIKTNKETNTQFMDNRFYDNKHQTANTMTNSHQNYQTKQKKVDQILTKSRPKIITTKNTQNTNNNYYTKQKDDEFKETTNFSRNFNFTQQYRTSDKSEHDDYKKQTSSKSMGQREFERYLNKLKLSMYHHKFVQNGCDDMRYLDILDDNILLGDIGMTSIHCKLFTKELKKFMENKSMFIKWINDLNLNEYIDALEDNGIFTFESFHRICKDKYGLLNIIKDKIDCDLMWKSTPKQKRKLLHQQQHQIEGYEKR